MSDLDALSDLARSMTNYRRGIFCPAELWSQLAHHLTGRDVPELLSALPADLQEILRGCYRERPLTLQAMSRDDELFGEIERWCQKADA